VKVLLLTSSFFIIFIQTNFAANRTDIDRYQLLRDKMKVNTVMKPYEHDFLLDIDVAISNKFKEVVDDSDTFVDANSSDTTAIANFLEKYNDTEYFLKIGLGLGVPLPSFSVGSFKISPDFRGFAEIGTSASITARAQDFITIDGATNNNSQSYIQLYAQQDFKYGLNIGYEYKNHIFGDLFLYRLDRWDRYEIVDAAELVTQEGDFIDLDEPKNTNHVLTTDFKIGYKVQQFKTYFSLEEMAISTTSKNGSLSYGVKPLFHFHAEYTWDLFIMDLTVFAGIMKRNSYEFDDGFYKGVLMDFNYFPLDASLMLDNEFITFQPKVDLWLLTLDYSLKKPINEKKDGFTSAVIHALNLRIAI
jgi:hypothetical protein